MRYLRITIIKTDSPGGHNINDALQWLGQSLGLFGERDKDKSCFRIFIELLKHLKKGGMSSDELAARLGLTRGTVVHHLNRLMEAGLVSNRNSKYFLNVENLSQLVDEVEANLQQTFSTLRKVAKKIDEQLEL
ncbi:MAG: ArsR family transcriptional regulator [archaeon]